MKDIHKTKTVNWKLIKPDALSTELQDFHGDYDLD